MDFMSFVKSLNGDFLKNKLLQAGISPTDLQWVDFSNTESINAFAEKIGPQILRSNPLIANIIKQNSSMLGEDKQKEVVQVIDGM